MLTAGRIDAVQRGELPVQAQCRFEFHNGGTKRTDEWSTRMEPCNPLAVSGGFICSGQACWIALQVWGSIEAKLTKVVSSHVIS
jgi:hypothetical protein